MTTSPWLGETQVMKRKVHTSLWQHRILTRRRIDMAAGRSSGRSQRRGD